MYNVRKISYKYVQLLKQNFDNNVLVASITITKTLSNIQENLIIAQKIKVNCKHLLQALVKKKVVQEVQCSRKRIFKNRYCFTKCPNKITVYLQSWEKRDSNMYSSSKMGLRQS